MRLTAELVDTSDGTQVWANAYQRRSTDVLLLEQEIVENLNGTLSLDAAPESALADRVKAWPTPELTGAYLQARILEEGPERRLARLAFSSIADQVPDDARAWAGLYRTMHRARMYGDDPKTEDTIMIAAAARTAAQLAPDLAEARAAMGSAQLWYEWDVPAALDNLQAAHRRQPNHPFINHEYTWALLAAGNVDAGLEQIQRAENLDPLSVAAIMDVGWAMLRVGRVDEAIAASMRTLLLEPEHSAAIYCIVRAAYLKGDYVTSIANVKKLLRLSGRDTSDIRKQLVGGDGKAQGERYLRWLARIWTESEDEPNRYDVAAVYALLGQADEAIAWLELSLERRDMSMLTLRLDPSFVGLKSDQRFAAIVARISARQY